MKQDLLIRLFRTFGNNRPEDTLKIAQTIIEDEFSKGHKKVAGKLQNILKKNNLYLNQTTDNPIMNPLKSNLSVIPTGQRNNIPLASIVNREELRHEMVLSLSIEDKICRIEKEYTARHRLANYGLKPRRKILFYGAPGCGKSMSAERIAWNIGLPFLKVKFEAIISSYLGESASNLIKLFDSIKNYPCVLLLDEFDFIANSRVSGQDVGEMRRVVNILLNILEDYDAPGLLIATTNLEGSLDKALFRRFDDVIEITKPGKNEIISILKNTLSAMKLAKDINWETLSSKMEGFSAALVVKVANDAAKYSVIQNLKCISMENLDNMLKENINYNK